VSDLSRFLLGFCIHELSGTAKLLSTLGRKQSYELVCF
jgi:hypothetical protein